MRGLLMLVAAVLAPLSAHAADWTKRSDDLTRQASVLIQKEAYVDAVAALEAAIVANPKNGRAFQALGRAYFGLGRYVQAQKYFLISLEIDPTAAGALAYLGEIDIYNEEIDAAADKLGVLSRVCGAECAEYKKLSAAISEARSQEGETR
ncbi:MAG: tetratricopeptide repeat protein [Pseudomonadota bacterium]